MKLRINRRFTFAIVFIIILVLFMSLQTETGWATNESSVRWQRYEELYALALDSDNRNDASKSPKNFSVTDNKYYNITSANYEANYWRSNISSVLSSNNSALNALCKKNKGGVPSSDKLPGHACQDYGNKSSTLGYECHGFANFAGWYLAAETYKDDVIYECKYYNKPFNKDTMKNARFGDIIRISWTGSDGKVYGHSAVFLYYHENQNKITVLDANWDNTYFGYSRIRVHNLSYSAAEKVSISRYTKFYGAKNQYTIKYNANGGTGTMSDKKVTYGTPYNLAKNTFTREGYKFTGWYGYRKSDQSWHYTNGTDFKRYKEGEEPEGWYKALWEDERYMAGKSSDKDGDVIICYAQWEKIDNDWPEIGFDDPVVDACMLGLHQWGPWEELNEEQHQRVCQKNASHVETADHSWDDGDVTIEPTEDEEGLKVYTCTECNAVRTEALDKLPHTHEWSDWAEYGSEQHQRICLKNDSHTETADHIWDEGSVTKEATESEEGVRTFTCTVCGAVKTVSIDKISPHVHEWGAWESVSESQHQRVCKIDSSHMEKADHKWNEGEITKEATTEEEGIRTFTCTDCGAVKTVAIAKLEETQAEDKPEKTPAEDKKESSEPSFDSGSTIKEVDKAIEEMKSDKDPSGVVFRKLSLRQKKVTQSYITVAWKKVTGAKKYVIYANTCGKNRLKKITTKKSTANTFTLKKINNKKLKKGKYYKFMVVAVNKNNKVICTSKILHIATKGGKFTNAKSITTNAKNNKLTLKKGKTFKLKVKINKVSTKLKIKTHREISYESSNKKIATVSKAGKITAKKKGTCYVYVYAQNGVFRKIKVTVKKN